MEGGDYREILLIQRHRVRVSSAYWKVEAGESCVYGKALG